MEAKKIADTIELTWAEQIARDGSRPANHEYVYASGYSDCLRRMVLDMVASDQLPTWDPETLAKFRRGSDRERDLLADLARVGRESDPPFNVVAQQQRFELRGRSGRVVIVGKVDARLSFGRAESFPLEVKSWSPNLTANIETFDDLMQNRWTRKGAHQLLMYLLGSGEHIGFLLLDRPGLPKVVPVELDDENLRRAEKFLAMAEEAVQHRVDGTLPDYCGDLEECQFCPFFRSICQAPTSYSPVDVLIDEELEQLLNRREELEPIAKEYETIDKHIKARFRPEPGIVVKTIVGPWILKGTWGSTTRYEIPEEVKKKYAVKDSAGRYTLKIERIGGGGEA